MTTTTPAPFLGAAAWAAVMEAAGFRCQCAGGCGRTHVADPEGRCRHTHKPSAHLIASPAVPTAGLVRAVSGPLVAYCPSCFDGHRRAANRAADTAAKQAAANVPSLFDLDLTSEVTA